MNAKQKIDKRIFVMIMNRRKADLDYTLLSDSTWSESLDLDTERANERRILRWFDSSNIENLNEKIFIDKMLAIRQ